MTDEININAAPGIAPRFVEGSPLTQTHIVNDAFGFAYIGSLFDVVLTTVILAPNEAGLLEAHHRIATRLRFDLDMAKALRTRLDQAIAALDSPPRDKVN